MKQPSEEEFWTVTSEHTKATNSQSTRYPTEQAAIDEAEARLARETTLKGVYILKAVMLVKPKVVPVDHVPLKPRAPARRFPGPQPLEDMEIVEADIPVPVQGQGLGKDELAPPPTEIRIPE